MKAQSPIDNQWYYFVDKCMPFGAAISCSHFQEFSDAISHIVAYITSKGNVNYLDDFFFAELLQLLCNKQISTFIDVCGKVNFPVSMEKTFWATTKLSFLGLLLDTVEQLICVPIEKIKKAKNMIEHALTKRNSKITLHQLQQITGFLNFLDQGSGTRQSLYKKTLQCGRKSITKEHEETSPCQTHKRNENGFGTMEHLPRPSKHLC